MKGPWACLAEASSATNVPPGGCLVGSCFNFLIALCPMALCQCNWLHSRHVFLNHLGIYVDSYLRWGISMNSACSACLEFLIVSNFETASPVSGHRG